jgi:quercetin dioxygenase-like cupin family protein
MRGTGLFVAAFILAAACSKESTSNGEISAPATASASRGPERDIQWGPAPAVFPPGAEMAVLQGDPSKTDEFTVRLRMPSGYKIPSHTHPTTENVTVITGTFLTGMGGVFNEAGMDAFGQGDFVSIPQDHAHYAMTRGKTIVQVHAIGPFALTYVNPADTPAASR